MIAYAACIADREKFTTICLPGLARVTTPDDLVIEATHPRSIFAAYNEVLDAVRDRDDLEALVLLHEDTEILGTELPAMVRRRLAEPDVAILGAVGALGVTGLAWWDAPQRFGGIVETRGVLHFSDGVHDVDTVDGLFMALAPWTVRNLRFDEDAYDGFDAYDADLCAQARAAGRRVIAEELPIVHRHTRVGVQRATADGGSFGRNDRIFRDKWRTMLAEAEARRAASGAGVRDAKGNDGYFEHTRPELRGLVPPGAGRVLDVGCGAGALGAALKGARPNVAVVGLEAFPDAAERARKRLDDVLCLDLDGLAALPAEAGTFDAMIFGDVLEHLRDPEAALRALLPSLVPGGVCIFSVPNVRHWSVLYPLLVEDRWQHAEAGLLDRTHMHFFTLEEFIATIAAVGLHPTGIGVNAHQPLPPSLLPFAAVAATVGGERSDAIRRLGAYQYLLTAEAAGPPGEPPPRVATEAPPAAEDLLALIPADARRVLDVGCDAGRTGAALREGRGCEVVGIESDVLLAEPARARLDDVIVADLDALEALPDAAGTFDAMLFDGTLARVRDPARLLRVLLPALAPGGVLVWSIPNVKHWSIFVPLYTEDRWSYTDDGGVLDRRNFHFLTLQEASNLLDEVGLEAIELVTRQDPLPERLSVLVDIAADYGGEREETLLRLSSREYLLAVRVAS